MRERDWDEELRRIDAAMAKQASSPAPASASGTTSAPAARPSPLSLPSRAATSGFGVYARLTLAVALGVGMLFWPYATRCGWGLGAYLGAVGVVIVSGVWSAVWTFRHRAGRAHVLALLLVLWGLVLAALDVLPRVGYAVPTVDHPAVWSCE
jgi:putative flippase GtrA